MPRTDKPCSGLMTEAPTVRVVVGYDGSLAASAAIEIGASLLARAHAWIGLLWTPPFASEALRRRLWRGTAAVNELVDAVEREGAAEANRWPRWAPPSPSPPDGPPRRGSNAPPAAKACSSPSLDFHIGLVHEPPAAG